jgi:protein-glutamine gamma-glutamyltransferase
VLISNNKNREKLMAQNSAKPGLIPLSQAINKYLELSLYLLVLTGFGTLASTGGVDLPAIVITGSALAFRGYLFTKRRRLVIPAAWTTPLTIFYVVFYSGDYFFLSRAFLPATVHLVLFAVVVRMFSLRRDRDYIMLAVLAFLMVLASAVLTVDSVFLLFFTGFTLVAVATFILMEMRRSSRVATFQARHSNDDHEHRHLAFSLIRVAPGLVLMILAGATALFFLMPRMSAGYLGAYSFGSDLSTGFSDRVQLGRIGQIQQSNAVVMHIQIQGDRHGEHALHWRGVALENFDGRNWWNSPQHYEVRQDFDGSFPVPWLSQGIAPANWRSGIAAQSSSVIHYRVLLEPIGASVFFLAPWGRRITGAYRLLAVDSGGSLFDADVQRPVSEYEAESDISRPSPAELRSAGNDFPAFTSGYLQSPPTLDPRIPRLAAQIAGSASNEYDKASAIERYLNSRYTYTLQLLQAPVADPLANFLFDRKAGHCEYFASAMAIMLRTLKIPARVVNGFRSDEFNDVTANYVVRAKNAHSWVEAYFPRYGWITFDPTPGGEIGTPEGWERAMLYLDAAQSFWREWVISYDTSHQSLLGKAAVGGTRSIWERLRIGVRVHYAKLLDYARHGQRDAELAPVGWAAGAALIVLLLAFLANVKRIVRKMREWRLRAHPERSPDLAAAMWYARMSRFLARRGIKKSAAQTPHEFICEVDDERLRLQVERFTHAYESARFGNCPEDARRLPELYEEVELAGKK